MTVSIFAEDRTDNRLRSFWDKQSRDLFERLNKVKFVETDCVLLNNYYNNVQSGLVEAVQYSLQNDESKLIIAKDYTYAFAWKWHKYILFKHFDHLKLPIVCPESTRLMLEHFRHLTCCGNCLYWEDADSYKVGYEILTSTCLFHKEETDHLKKACEQFDTVWNIKARRKICPLKKVKKKTSNRRKS